MADELKTEEEQIEEFRAWWSAYGNFVIAGVAGMGLAIFGWNYMSNTERDASYAASSLYMELTNEIVDEDLEASEALVNTIIAEHADTPYFVQAKFAIARLYMDQNRDEDAADALRDVLAADGHDALKPVAALRLAKILLYQEKAEDALATLDNSDSEAFAARFNEVRGDAHVMLGNFDAARDAYNASLQAVGQTVDQNFIRLKLFDLPAPTPVAEAVTAEPAEEEVEDTESSETEDTSNEEGGA